MASIKQPVLTIAIPTYNRSRFLDRALNYISIQVKDINYPIEIIVSDNCSTDDTTDIVNKHIEQGLLVQYIKNIKNMGADFNIAQCYDKASGKYVVAFGDDDVLLDGSIKYLVELLQQEKEYGVVFLEHGTFVGQKKVENEVIKVIEFDNSLEFIRKVNFFTTFISANIVNKKFINNDIYKNLDTNLIQLPLILKSILESDTNIYIESVLLAAEPDNTGGYNSFEIFGENLNHLIDKLDYTDKTTLIKVKEIINKALLKDFFPIHIINSKKKDYKFTNSNPVNDLKSIYYKYLYYWLLCFPVAKLPITFAQAYYRFVRKGCSIISKMAFL
jgi:abequosyltransferase